MGRVVRGRSVRLCGGIGSLVALLVASAQARAQEPGTPPAIAPSAPPAEQPPQAYPPPPPPPPAPLPPPIVQSAPEAQPIDHGPSDFNPALRRWAIGYAGISQAPVTPGAGGQTLTIPAVGLRYWASPTVGLDVAAGVGYAGGSQNVDDGTNSLSTDKNSIGGFVLQAGVPFALATHRHVSFQVIPTASVTYASTTIGTGTSAEDVSGMRIDVGARAGFELFFGFIGIPELALSATIGVQFEYLRYAASMDTATGKVSGSDTTYAISTTVQNNPWDFFTGGVAARYYF